MTEKRSKVTFQIEPAGSAVKLTLIHDGFEGETEMLRAVSGKTPPSGGWPEIVANLKSLLETGDTFDTAAAADEAWRAAMSG